MQGDILAYLSCCCLKFKLAREHKSSVVDTYIEAPKNTHTTAWYRRAEILDVYSNYHADMYRDRGQQPAES